MSTRERFGAKVAARAPAGRRPMARTDGAVDVDALVADLRRRVDGEILFDRGSRALYGTDSSNYRETPIGVVIPYSVEGIAATVDVCRRYGAPILHRGAGTSLAGQTTNMAVIIDGSKYCDRVIDISADDRSAWVEPGVRQDALNEQARPYGLIFGPDPSTHAYCTLGGMIGNNSAGVHSVQAGTTAETVRELEILTYDGVRMTVGATAPDALERIISGGGPRGEIYRRLKDLRDRYAPLIRERYPRIPRRVSGYNLDQLLPEQGFNVARALAGTEGTCVTILRARVDLVPRPGARVLLAIGFEDVTIAADYVPRILEHRPIGLEGIDERLVDNMRKKHLLVEDLPLLPEGDAWLLAEFGADHSDEAVDAAHAAMRDLGTEKAVIDMRPLIASEQQERIWKIREAGLGATAFVPGRKRDHWPGWEDSAVAREDLGDYLRDLRRLYAKYDYQAALYGHFGDGLVHTRIDFGLETKEDTRRFRAFMEEAADLVTRYNGSLSGEHGDGQARAELLPKMFGPEIVRAFEEFKAVWDPADKMNPGKIVRPRRLDEDLRLGARLHPPHLETVFKYPDDGFSFARATLRCVGVGKCRRLENGTMCPSFRATREERYTTRGRARLLQEMLYGAPIADGWKNETIRDALDLCLGCKGCKHDCPVNVDMATYKAEFLAHHYRGRLRPRAAYGMGQIWRWARLAEYAPWLPNLFTQTPGLGAASRLVAGIARDRPLPRFAKTTFRRSFTDRRRRRESASAPRPTVVLWTDTFNNHFEPGPLHAAAAVLDDAGFEVEIPPSDLCCGRPLYDFGMLDQAKRLLRRTIVGLRAQLDAGAYVVGVEPSCTAVFRDELPGLFPDDPEARRLCDRSMLFGEFLDKVAHYTPPHIGRKAMVHGHCNHKAVFGMDADKAVMRRGGLDFTVLDSGCCGMAGAFGYESRKYPISMKIFDLDLKPKILGAPDDTLIITDGYSCREQIAQASPRRAVTLPEVLADALSRRRGGKAV